jgi:hypothetical protein
MSRSAVCVGEEALVDGVADASLERVQLRHRCGNAN